MRRRDENGFGRNAIHVDARSGFHVVQMDVTIFGDQIKDVMLRADLRKETSTLRKGFFARDVKAAPIDGWHRLFRTL